MKLFKMCSFLNNLFTVTGNNNTMYGEHRIGNRNCDSKLPIIVFQINPINLTLKPIMSCFGVLRPLFAFCVLRYVRHKYNVRHHGQHGIY